MTNGADLDSVPPDEMSDVLTRVRQLDPKAEERAVQIYVREIAEADALIDTVDLGDSPLSISFSALWSEGGLQ